MTTPKETNQTDLKPKILVIGAIIGALTGVGAAYLLLQRADEDGLEMTPGEGVKLGVTILSFLRQITQLG